MSDRITVENGLSFHSTWKGQPFTVHGYAEIDTKRGLVTAESGEVMTLDSLIACAAPNLAALEQAVVEAAVTDRLAARRGSGTNSDIDAMISTRAELTNTSRK